MSISLEKLPEALSQQYKSLCEISKKTSGVRNKVSQEYVLGESSVNVIVKMKQIRSKLEEGMPYCGGKLSQDTVKVSVSPADETVIRVLSDHFKGQVYPALFMSPARPLFDEVVINHEKILLQ